MDYALDKKSTLIEAESVGIDQKVNPDCPTNKNTIQAAPQFPIPAFLLFFYSHRIYLQGCILVE